MGVVQLKSKPKLEKTNLQGYSKDKSTNTLVCVDEEKIKQIKRSRDAFLRQQGVNKQVDYLNYKIQELEERLAKLEDRMM